MFSPHGTICCLTSRRKTDFTWQPEAVETPWSASLAGRAKEGQANASTRTLLNPSPGQGRDRGCAWSSVPFLWQWEVPVRHQSCSISMLGWAHSCSQNMLPSSHLILTQLFLLITSAPIFSLCNSHKASPFFPGRDQPVWLLLLPDVFIPPFQPLDHGHELWTASTGDLENHGEMQPSPSTKNLSVYFER